MAAAVGVMCWAAAEAGVMQFAAAAAAAAAATQGQAVKPWVVAGRTTGRAAAVLVEVVKPWGVAMMAVATPWELPRRSRGVSMHVWASSFANRSTVNLRPKHACGLLRTHEICRPSQCRVQSLHHPSLRRIGRRRIASLLLMLTGKVLAGCHPSKQAIAR